LAGAAPAFVLALLESEDADVVTPMSDKALAIALMNELPSRAALAAVLVAVALLALVVLRYWADWDWVAALQPPIELMDMVGFLDGLWTRFAARTAFVRSMPGLAALFRREKRIDLGVGARLLQRRRGHRLGGGLRQCGCLCVVELARSGHRAQRFMRLARRLGLFAQLRLLGVHDCEHLVLLGLVEHDPVQEHRRRAVAAWTHLPHRVAGGWRAVRFGRHGGGADDAGAAQQCEGVAWQEFHGKSWECDWRTHFRAGGCKALSGRCKSG
jgi:hypothetical protein